MNLSLQQEPWTNDEISLVVALLYSGIGFYHNLISKLHEEFRLTLDGVIEFPLYKYDYGLASFSNGWFIQFVTTSTFNTNY